MAMKEIIRMIMHIGAALSVVLISMIVLLPAHADASDELQLSVQHINAADYSAQPDSGAISAWMALKYLGNGSDSHISTLSKSAIAYIYDYGRSLQPTGPFNQNTVQDIMNQFEIDLDYHYNFIYGTDFNDLVNEIAFWMNRDIPNVEPYPINAPAIIPFSGTYDHWVVVTGTLADDDPYQNPDTTVRGLWIDDPAIYKDPFMPVQTNIFYSTEEGVMNNLDDFYLPISTGNLAGNFLAVVPVPIPSAKYTPDAGDNIQILSADQLYTVILGTATDPDGDTLEYRWVEGDQVLLDWSPVGPNGEAYLDLGTLPYLSVGDHTLTLEVRDVRDDGSSLTASDDMILTIQNSPPQVQPQPYSQVVQIDVDPIVVVAQVSDYDGDTVSYEWLKGSEGLDSGSVGTVQGGDPVAIPDLNVPAGDPRFPLGTHSIVIEVSDGVNDPVIDSVWVTVQDTTAPGLSPVTCPLVSILWPPNHTLRPVTICANAYDNDFGGSITLDVAVDSSESPDTNADGNTIPDFYIDSVTWDAETGGVIELRLRAERQGTGDGRVYTITITATDVSGNESIATLEVLAPHDKRKK